MHDRRVSNQLNSIPFGSWLASLEVGEIRLAIVDHNKKNIGACKIKDKLTESPRNLTQAISVAAENCWIGSKMQRGTMKALLSVLYTVESGIIYLRRIIVVLKVCKSRLLLHSKSLQANVDDGINTRVTCTSILMTIIFA